MSEFAARRGGRGSGLVPIVVVRLGGWPRRRGEASAENVWVVADIGSSFVCWMGPLGGKRETGLVKALWPGGNGSGLELEGDKGVDGLEVEICLTL